jgi:hypothetical protein
MGDLMTVVLKNSLLKNSVLRSWKPTDINNLNLWLDGDDSSTITLNGSNVSQWDDKSGNGYNATQTTAANQPLYNSTGLNNKGILDFNGSSHYLSYPSVGSTDAVTVFVVVKADTLASFRHILGSNGWAIGYTHFLYGNTTRFSFAVNNRNPTDAFATNPFNTGVYRIVGVTADSSNVKFYLNGGADGTTPVVAPQTMTLGAGKIGAWENLVATVERFWDGQIAEIIIYNKVLSTTERQAVETYLTNKWGIS